jgi:hypothetical protein
MSCTFSFPEVKFLNDLLYRQFVFSACASHFYFAIAIKRYFTLDAMATTKRRSKNILYFTINGLAANTYLCNPSASKCNSDFRFGTWEYLWNTTLCGVKQ